MRHLWGGLPLDLRVKTHIKTHVDVFKKSSYIILIFQKWPNRIDRLQIRRARFILTQFFPKALRAKGSRLISQQGGFRGADPGGQVAV